MAVSLVQGEMSAGENRCLPLKFLSIEFNSDFVGHRLIRNLEQDLFEEKIFV